MYTPNLMPRDVHHLWMHPPQQKLPQKKDGEQTNYYAPPLSSYTSARPGAAFNENHDPIEMDIQSRLRQLKEIRTLGYSYLTPLGVGKTMETLDEEIEMKRQIEEQFQESTTAENLLGEAELADANEVQQQQQQQQQVPPMEASQLQRTPQMPQMPQMAPGTPMPQQDPLETDLDDEIPEAEENSYSYHDHGDLELDSNTFESQYDRGFMITEQYEEESSQPPPQQTQFETPVRLEAGPARQFSGRSASFITESSFDVGNASINESDLDMAIDD